MEARSLARGALHHNGIDEVSEMVESMRGRMLGNIMGETFFRIPEPYVVEADSVLGPLRERFGEEWVPEGALYPQVADLMAMSSILTPVVNTARDENRVVSLAEFRQVAAEAAEFSVVGKIAKAEADAIAAELRLGPLPGTFGNLLLRYLPALNSALRAAPSSGDVRAALDGFRESIRDLVRQEVRLGALVRGSSDAMAEKLGGRFGIEPAEARRRFGYSLHLADRMNKLKDGILYGTYPGCREPGFSAEEEMRNIIDGITEEYVEKLVLVDGLRDVTDETRERLRAIVRQQSRPDKPFVDVRHAQRIAAKVDGSSLLAALGDPNATDEARFEAIRKYADAISDAAKAEFAEERELGSDELQPVVALVRAFVIGANPGLGAALERLAADPFVLRVGPHFMQKEHQDHPLRATVASTLL